MLADLVRRHKAEIAHAQLHTDPISLLERLTGCEVVLHARHTPTRRAGPSSQPGDQPTP